ncbi:DUF2163 domain-containing protein [Rhodobacteraceae bacterium 2376]|uniref:DUF2163 domain-containing protein n=1 Tax=Rhabdonatronobacter sediminivivens TaxID=2743469 RepID=A0A7Z0KXV0_9RHOB|nr:DUF2163 domain-containing protein [Rhabdonatronobacter sediminivivens]NYS23961.1 DUF2163 domain-containing protein [Rhabdonatronobacter sediminivivens]
MSLQEHLSSGLTTVCRAWQLTRADGTVLGFTDHDRDLSFDGVTFRADAGMSARALDSSTGLSVDNSEAMGALIDSGLTEADILAGLYDGAALVIWEVNWADPSQRRVAFRGTIGEITRAGGAFQAELRGLTEPLGQTRGRVFQTGCGAVLGDSACGFDLSLPGFAVDLPAEVVHAGQSFDFADLPGFEDRWFEFGRLRVLEGAAAGQVGVIRSDRLAPGGQRSLQLWQQLGRAPAPGDLLRLEAGCDKRAASCRLKFNNLRNFRGFPHIPREDWLLAYPRTDGVNDGGRLRGGDDT